MNKQLTLFRKCYLKLESYIRLLENQNISEENNKEIEEIKELIEGLEEVVN